MGTLSNNSHGKNELQLKIGDQVSIYSEKAYRRDNGSYFEAVGNVIIISGKDTLYGEKASLNSKSGEVKLEGSVRYIGQDMTIYGSKIEFNMITGSLEMINARMITSEFSIVATQILKKSEKVYYAKDAEFTTCRDCKESWMISGKEIFLEIGQYVEIYAALAKVKGIDVLYFPYIALPVKNKRESGFLFPNFRSKEKEGFIYEQPVFWAISDSSDATFTPNFLGERGLGIDLEYRQVFGEMNWVEFNNKMIMDAIYQPNEKNDEVSGFHEFRHFYELENHTQWSNSLSHHLNIQGVEDLDFYKDFSIYTEEKLQMTDIGADFFLDKRFDEFSMALEANYKRNILSADPKEFDKSYVQTLPSVSFSWMPQIWFQSERSYLYKVSSGLDGRFTTFKQDNIDESVNLRNVNRSEVYPYLNVNLLNVGPLNMNSKLSLDYQEYDFHDDEEKNFYKHSTLLSTEISFTLDRIFGLAYEESYDIDEFEEKDLIKFKGVGKKDNKEKQKKKNIIGNLPSFQGALAKEVLNVKSYSYRHSQEYKFIHHQLLNADENGNQRFLNQIKTEEGWFDYREAITENLSELESNVARKNIPLDNTLEIQWNNSLIKKSPKSYHYLIDEKYLKDQFQYKKIGFFNISQGVFLDNDETEFEDQLTRLFVDSGYNANTWIFRLSDYYFHNSGDNIMKFSSQKRFDTVSLLAAYNLNTFESSKQRTLKTGLQFRPHDVLGFSYLQDFDLDADQNKSTIYQVDFMPLNNCWILNLNYRDNFTEKQLSFNFVFNFGNQDFKDYRTDFFSFNRLRY